MRKLIKFFIIVPIIFTTNTALLSQNKEVLTNEDIINLHKLGLDELVVISKIKSSECNFDVSISSLVALKEAGLSGAIINEMMATNESDLLKRQEEERLEAIHQPGIFYIKRDGEEVEVEANLYSNSKTNGAGRAIAQTVGRLSGGWGTQLAMDAVNQKTKAVLPNPNAKTQINESQPEFNFYFEATEAGLSGNGYSMFWYNLAVSPNEFLLVKMNVKKKSREVITARSNSYTYKSGIKNKDSVNFNFEELEPGIYRVYFNEPLEQGEYCFVYASAVATNQGIGQKVFDFGIRN